MKPPAHADPPAPPDSVESPTPDRRARAGSAPPHSVHAGDVPTGYAQRGHRPRLARKRARPPRINATHSHAEVPKATALTAKPGKTGSRPRRREESLVTPGML